MQPSDSLASFDRGSGSPCQRPTSWGRRLFCRFPRRPTRAPADVPTSEMDHRLSGKPETPEERQGLPGYWAILFIRAVVQHPAGTDPSSPILPLRRSTERPASPSRNYERSATGMTVISRPLTHGPHARVPTHRRPRYRGRRQAHYRLGRARPWPGGIRTRGTANKISWSHRNPPIPIDQQGLVASQLQRPAFGTF
jgi:hypothetical protein